MTWLQITDVLAPMEGKKKNYFTNDKHTARILVWRVRKPVLVLMIEIFKSQLSCFDAVNKSVWKPLQSNNIMT